MATSKLLSKLELALFVIAQLLPLNKKKNQQVAASPKDALYYIFIALAAIFSKEQNSLSNFGRGSPKEHSCMIISKSMQCMEKKSI